MLKEWFDIAPEEEAPDFEPTYNAAPQSRQPVVRLNRDSGRREFALLRWGLVPAWAKDEKLAYSMINARAEEVAEKPAYRDALKKRRCLVPSDAFYEWQRTDAKNKQAFAFSLESREPYALAGLWERWKPKEGEPLETFTILTTDPNELMETVHNRMPVILRPKDYARWLEPGDPQQLPLDLLRPFPAEKMKKWRVGDRVGNVRNNNPQLLEEVLEECTQPEQGLLF